MNEGLKQYEHHLDHLNGTFVNQLTAQTSLIYHMCSALWVTHTHTASQAARIPPEEKKAFLKIASLGTEPIYYFFFSSLRYCQSHHIAYAHIFSFSPSQGEAQRRRDILGGATLQPHAVDDQSGRQGRRSPGRHPALSEERVQLRSEVSRLSSPFTEGNLISELPPAPGRSILELHHSAL